MLVKVEIDHPQVIDRTMDLKQIGNNPQVFLDLWHTVGVKLGAS
jgi:hypothetical protein